MLTFNRIRTQTRRDDKRDAVHIVTSVTYCGGMKVDARAYDEAGPEIRAHFEMRAKQKMWKDVYGEPEVLVQKLQSLVMRNVGPVEAPEIRKLFSDLRALLAAPEKDISEPHAGNPVH